MDQTFNQGWKCAEQFISCCQEATQLQRWLTLVVAECASWEEQTLAVEAAQRNCKNALKRLVPGL